MTLDCGYGRFDITPFHCCGLVCRGGQWQQPHFPDFLPAFSCLMPVLQPFHGLTGAASTHVCASEWEQSWETMQQQQKSGLTSCLISSLL